MRGEPFDIQLLDYITGHLADAEYERMREWIEEEEAHRDYYERFYLEYLRQRWYFRARLIREKGRRRYAIRGWRRRVARYVIPLAASVVLLLGVFWGYQSGMWERGPGPVVATSGDIVPGTLKAKLMVDEEQVIPLDDNTSDVVEIAGVQPFVKTPGNIDYRGNEERSLYVRHHLLIVEKGGEYAITLEDSTFVQLNSASTLGYPVVFTGNERRVKLSGEAYFRVKSNQEIPFIVEVGDISIQVTGTEFNVNTHKKNQIETVLVTGSVDIIKDTCRYPLKISQKATYMIDSKEVIVEPVEIDTYVAWKNGDIIFVDERLEDIMYKLSLWYDFEVFYAQPEVKDILLSGDMMKYDRIENLLYFFENSSGIVFEITGRKIVVSMKK
ncbi:MAG: FecR domain-containing protein [Odoribacteraceae bacterium]|jgi:ferric-dicitrate binding protein FerR (iron transport regulator)|nr:FecR domain-containing protein [Odoribacteraceae bacterium]